MQRLGANPDTVYVQTVIAKNPTSGLLTSRRILLVPGPDGKDFQIIDSQGEIFANYDEFLLDNTMPR